MILCDTNIWIEFYKGNPQVLLALQQMGVENLAISAVSQAELYFGALNKQELRQIKRHLSAIHSYPLDLTVSHLFLQLMELYSLSHNLTIPDALIASTALSYDVPLYTLNVKDFRYIPNLILYQPE